MTLACTCTKSTKLLNVPLKSNYWEIKFQRHCVNYNAIKKQSEKRQLLVNHQLRNEAACQADLWRTQDETKDKRAVQVFKQCRCSGYERCRCWGYEQLSGDYAHSTHLFTPTNSMLANKTCSHSKWSHALQQFPPHICLNQLLIR